MGERQKGQRREKKKNAWGKEKEIESGVNGARAVYMGVRPASEEMRVQDPTALGSLGHSRRAVSGWNWSSAASLGR